MTDENFESIIEAAEGDKESPSSSVKSNDTLAKETKIPTKVVIRRLPSSMKEPNFLDSVAPLPDHDYFHFSEADPTLVPYGLGRATINFINEDDVYSFKEKFDGYVFVDNKGHEYPAVVEFAPNQKIPKKPRFPKDTKIGTIDEDPEFLSFLENLKNPTKSSRTVQQCLEDIDIKEKELKDEEKLTPLLEFIREKADKKRHDRDQRKESRKKREEDRKKVREEERKIIRERKEREIKERELRDREKNCRDTTESLNARHHSRTIKTEKHMLDDNERHKLRKHFSEVEERADRRIMKGNKASLEEQHPSRTSINVSCRSTKEIGVSKSNGKDVSRSTNWNIHDRQKTEKSPQGGKAANGREEQRKTRRDRNQLKQERLRGREEGRQTRFPIHKDQKQLVNEPTIGMSNDGSRIGDVDSDGTNNRPKTLENTVSKLSLGSPSYKSLKQDLVHSGTVKSKRYSGQREDKLGKPHVDSRSNIEIGDKNSATLDQMGKDLSNMLCLDRAQNERIHPHIEYTRDNLDMETPKNWETPALQSFRTRVEVQSSHLSSTNRTDRSDRGAKNLINKDRKYCDEKNFRITDNNNRQKEMDKGIYKGETSTRSEFKGAYKYEGNYRIYSGISDQTGRRGKEPRNCDNKTSVENRKGPEGKLDYRNKSKGDLDTARHVEVHKNTSRYDRKNYNSGNDRRNMGNNFDEKTFFKPYSPKEDKECSTRDKTRDRDNFIATNNDAPASSYTAKETERSGKSYRSKRKEKEQQRSEH